jgi:two-component system, NtrC family, response regulator PilR
MAAILVVDDEASMREFLEILLRKQGHRVFTAADLEGAAARVADGGVDLVITDLRLGAESGLDVLRRVKERSPATEVVVVTAFATTENAVQAMKLGAHDYVLKPFKVDELRLVVEKALEHRALVQENRVLRHRVGKPRLAAPEIIGAGAANEEVRALVEKVAPTRTTVLVTGESGVGKEVVARAIHDGSDRRREPFVAINCGAIPEGLIESELFGHEKGSFTGAVEAKAGIFEVAGEGTLFLDEVAELPLHLQVRLLRALQERKIRRVGGTTDLAFAARIIAATNRELGDEVASGRFREDLYYRLNVIQLRVPPLRTRREDVPLFVAHFLARFGVEAGKADVRLSPEAERRLAEYDYPGNVRELANVVERAVTLADGPVIQVSDLPPALRVPADSPPPAAVTADLPEAGMDLQAHLDGIERRLLDEALARAGGVKTEAARLLSLTFRSLRYRLAKFGIGER